MGAVTAGYTLDRYEILMPLARGGMASVWLARQRGKHGFSKLVAIKTMLPELAGDAAFHDMFIDEARIAARIEHPNVAQILDVGEQDGVIFIVMEWVEGHSLSKLRHAVSRAGARLPLGVCLRILADACAGLHAAHSLRDRDGSLLGVVHRDVSPQNILVSSRGVAKIIDFGVAKSKNRLAGHTSTPSLKGKVSYMAPEQATGSATIDPRADVWAIGATLYDLLVGRPPYLGDNELATLAMLMSKKPPPPPPMTLPRGVLDVLDHTLCFEPSQRFATAHHLQSALEEAMARAGCTTTSADVAAFVTPYLAEHDASMRADVQKAFEDADARERRATARGHGSSQRMVTVPDVAPPTERMQFPESVSPVPVVATLPRFPHPPASPSQPSFTVATPRRSRGFVVFALAAVAMLAAGAGGAALSLRAHRDVTPSDPTSAAREGTEPPPVPTGEPRSSASAAALAIDPPAGSASAAARETPAPSGSDAGTAAPSTRRAQPIRREPHRPTPPSTKPGIVDDGF